MQNKMSNLKFILTEYGKQWQTISILTTMLTISYSPGYSTSDGDTFILHKFLLLRLNSESTIFLFYINWTVLCILFLSILIKLATPLILKDIKFSNKIIYIQ